MKRKITLLMLSIMSLTAVTGCTQETDATINKTGTITFYNKDKKLGEITGKAGEAFSDADKAKIKGFETKPNYAFRGWYSDIELKKPENVKYYSFKDYNVYANFKPYVRLKLNPNGGTLPKGVNSYIEGVSGDQITTELPTPTKENAYFDHWFYKTKDPNTNEMVDKEFNEFKFPEQTVELVAHYNDFPVLSFVLPKDKFGSIKLDDVIIDPEKIVSEQFTFGDNIKAIINPSATASYRFDGWYILKDLGPDMTEADRYVDCNQFFFNQKLEKDTTIFPKFTEKATVTFVVEGATETIFAPVTKYTDEKLNAPEITEAIDKKLKALKPNSYFTGWSYKDENDVLKPYSFINMPQKDLTLYATFTKNPLIKIYKDKSKSGNPILSLNTYSPDEKIIVDDLTNLDAKLGLKENESINHWVVEKVDQSDVTTTQQLTKEDIGGVTKSTYLVQAKDSKLKSISFYPVIDTTYTLKVYEANYLLDTSLGRYTPSKTTHLLTETTGITNFYEPLISITDTSKTKVNYYRPVKHGADTVLEQTSFPLPTENGILKEVYLLLAKKIKMSVGEVRINNEVISSNVGEIELGYQNIVSDHKLIDIDKTNGTLLINGDETKLITNEKLKTLDLAEIQLYTGSGSSIEIVKDLVFDHNYNLRVPFVDLGSTSKPVNIRLIANF